jgi:hypothetical protein
VRAALSALSIAVGCEAQGSSAAIVADLAASSVPSSASVVAVPSASVTAPPAPSATTKAHAPCPLHPRARLQFAGGHVEVFDRSLEEECDDFDFAAPRFETIVRWETADKKRWSTLRFEHAQSPSAKVMRFGDAVNESLALSYEVHWVTGYAVDTVVVELEDDKLLWRHATHAKTGERKAIETHHSFSGASVSADALGEALFFVGCGQAGPKGECPSNNRIFYVKDGKWWWDEREGTACIAKTNGWCAARQAFPPRSEFP